MAVMFPVELPSDVRKAPDRDAECRLYDALARLPGAYRVFYSVAWIARRTTTGAIEGEADFVVVHPERGILVLEVKGGYVSFDKTTLEWFSETRGAGKRYEIKDPVAQAMRNKHNLKSKLHSLPQWVAGKPKLGHGVAFPHCAPHRDGLSLECPAEIVLYAPDLEDIETAIGRLYEYWTGTKESLTPVDAAAMRAIVHLFAPAVELRPAMRSPAAEVEAAEKLIAELTQQQAKVLSALARNRGVAISGGAGTGKTMLALAKAKHLAEQGFHTLLTCYNRPLGDYLRAAAQGHERLEVADFHQYCIATIGGAGLSVGRPEGTCFWEETVPNAMAEALALSDRRFDAIVVDEAQDFADGWWVPLQLGLRDPDQGVLYVFYDDNQRLYRRVNSFPSNLAEYSLCENLRNTKQIHDAAARFYDGGELIAVGPDGALVEFVLAADSTTQKREIGKLLDRFIQGGVKPSDIAVLTGRSVELSRAGSGGSFGQHRWTQDQEREPNRPLFESIARFKGLERPVIILAEMEDLVSAERDESVYVGLSRAKSHLAVVGSTDVLRYLGNQGRTGKQSVGPTNYLRALLGEA